MNELASFASGECARKHMTTVDWAMKKPATQVIDLFTPVQFSTTVNQFPRFTCAYKMSGYTFSMRSSKYILWQDDNGWRGYIQGYPEYEAQGESFEELQTKLWQLHQELTTQHRDQGVIENENTYQPDKLNQHHPSHSYAHGHTSNHIPTLPRPVSRAQSKRRARVEELMFAMISNR